MVPFAGVAVNDEPVHIAETIAVTTGLGLMVTVTVNGVPMQVPVRGVTVYVAV